MNEPEIVFADEPTASLDTLSTKTVMNALTDLNRDLGVTVVFVSHDPDHRAYATSLVFLRDGRIVEPYF
jgi:putative ABC transport system ATP-binding protein